MLQSGNDCGCPKCAYCNTSGGRLIRCGRDGNVLSVSSDGGIIVSSSDPCDESSVEFRSSSVWAI